MMSPEYSGNFEWTSFALGFVGAGVLMMFLGWRRRRRAKTDLTDLTAPPQFPVQASELPSDLRPIILQLKAEGRKIEAIKLVRERTGIGLAEAKDLVDNIR